MIFRTAARAAATAAATATALSLLLAGCANADGSTTDSAGPAGPADAADLADLPPDALVLRVEHTGGFTTPEAQLTRLPLISVYADGRVITEGAQTLVYPGPALPNLQVREVDDEGVATLVARARAAGVGGPTQDYGQPPVADAPHTRFTLDTGADQPSVAEVYALSETIDANGLTPAQNAARGKLSDLLSALTDLPATLKAGGGTLGAQLRYEPTAVAAVASPYQADPSVPAPAPVAWPGPALPGDVDSAGAGVGCLTASGAAAAQVLAAGREASALTPWTSGGKRWRVGLRPLLPDESGCADLRA